MSFSALFNARTVTLLALGLLATGISSANAEAVATEPTYTVSDTSVTEGDTTFPTATVTITRSGDISLTSTVRYFTYAGTATKGVDYVHIPSTSSLTFAPGETSKIVTVQVLGDTTDEPDEDFSVRLSVEADPSRLAIGNVTILDDDLPPPPAGPNAVSVTDRSFNEGSSGTSTGGLYVTRDGDISGSASVSWRTVAGTATAGVDYTTSTGTASFAPGQSSAFIAVPISADTLFEPDETFTVELSNPTGSGTTITPGAGTATATILNDDVQPTVYTIGDLSVPEGNSGTTPGTLTITRSGNTATPASVSVRTPVVAANTAARDSDYLMLSTLATFAPGQTNTTVTVDILGDTTAEPDETFSVNLGLPAGTTGDNKALVTIVNDD